MSEPTPNSGTYPPSEEGRSVNKEGIPHVKGGYLKTVGETFDTPEQAHEAWRVAANG